MSDILLIFVKTESSQYFKSIIFVWMTAGKAASSRPSRLIGRLEPSGSHLYEGNCRMCIGTVRFQYYEVFNTN